MASTPPFKPFQNNQHPSQNNFKHRRHHHHHHRQEHSRTARPPFVTDNAAGPTTDVNPYSLRSDTAFPSLPLDFSSRRSTRIYSKINLGRPRSTTNIPRSSLAEEVLEYIKNTENVDDILFSFKDNLCSSTDYVYLMKELGNIREWEKALKCFQFAIATEMRKTNKGKLASNIISTLGRLGKIEIAKSIFESAFDEGYGNTVYCFSALISAYGKSGLSSEALKLFYSLTDYGIRPNLVAYNSVIDACAKGGVEFDRVKGIFNEMLRDGIKPDSFTFNSLITACGRVGDWETARNVFNQMFGHGGIRPNIFTYNIFIDALCKGGQMDLALSVLQEMPSKGVTPNIVSYSTVVDGYSKADRFKDTLCMLDKMRSLGFVFDTILYNTMVTVYGKLGKFQKVLDVCKEMQVAGISRDNATYNALVDAYAKHGRFDEVKRVLLEMKQDKETMNLLTYSSLIGAYLKHGLPREAIEVMREQMQQGVKPDVVQYNAVINVACKYGLKESVGYLVDDMLKRGIIPNVFTFNSIINSFGHPVASECRWQTESFSSVATEIDAENNVENAKDDRLMQVFGQLLSEKGGQERQDNRGRRDHFCILDIVRKMHQMNIKPNVVTFSAILNACSQCNSIDDASMLLEELRWFDNQVYSVAYGLLMGSLGSIWLQALSLFDELRRMDFDTASGFYNALTDVLWHFDQKYGAQLVALEGKHRYVWNNSWSASCLDLHLMSSGAAQAMVHAWLLDIHSIVVKGYQLPNLLSILTGWGKHSKVVGEGTLRRVIEALLKRIDAPFRLDKHNIGRFISQGPTVASWLRKSSTYDILILQDARTKVGYLMFGQFPSQHLLTYM